MKKSIRRPFRYILLATLFILVCTGFVARIIHLRTTTTTEEPPPQTTTRTFTIKALRGEIYDRNGNKLVSNSYSYSIYLDGSDFPCRIVAFCLSVDKQSHDKQQLTG